MSRHPTDLDWPMADSANAGDEYVKYAEVYDVLFGDLHDDAAFYLRCAEAQLPRGGALLELGTGTGRVAEQFARAGYRVTGVDASAEMLACAKRKVGDLAPLLHWVHADIRSMRLEGRYGLAVAPYGMVAHLLTDDDRRAAFRCVHDHLEPGGVFVFDDMPAWLSGPDDSSRLEVRKTGFDAAAGMPVRLMSNSIAVAGKPLSVRYDFVDWLEGGKVAKRLVIRVVFRDMGLEDELRLLKEAGFGKVEMFSDFDGRRFDAQDLASNKRLIMRCHRP